MYNICNITLHSPTQKSTPQTLNATNECSFQILIQSRVNIFMHIILFIHYTLTWILVYVYLQPEYVKQLSTHNYSHHLNNHIFVYEISTIYT